ncbi:hypothetical protein AN958_09399 [Leucoagaricus sp. SymC.cos]|nr:hypothetical protein AN958_09399 [Leucoagaricus sp. SymC.cos]
MDSKSSKSSSFLLAAARLATETDRADAAERQVADLLAQIRLLHQDKLQLRAELAKSHQELQLWKVQLDLAQKEILRAQTVVDHVDRARADAEERAHRYRQRVRELVEERSVQVAMDEGRRRGFEEGLEAGRRSQIRYPMPVYPVPKPRLTPRPPSRRETASQSVPVPPAPISAPTPVALAPQRPITDPEPQRSPSPEEIHSPRPVADQPIRPIPVHNGVEVVHDTFDVPPDNFIPVIREGEGGIALPPPHEWTEKRQSDRYSGSITTSSLTRSRIFFPFPFSLFCSPIKNPKYPLTPILSSITI